MRIVRALIWIGIILLILFLGIVVFQIDTPIGRLQAVSIAPLNFGHPAQAFNAALVPAKTDQVRIFLALGFVSRDGQKWYGASIDLSVGWNRALWLGAKIGIGNVRPCYDP